jgi:hypothetical protein
MRMQCPSLGTFVSRFATVAGRSHLRQFVVVGAIVAAAYCQFNAARADDAIAINPTTVRTIADSLDPPPQIINFAASRVDTNVWVVSGTVIDDNLGSIIVELGAYLLGTVNVSPGPDGSFSYCIYMAPGSFAYISAIAIDAVESLQSLPVGIIIYGS